MGRLFSRSGMQTHPRAGTANPSLTGPSPQPLTFLHKEGRPFGKQYIPFAMETSVSAVQCSPWATETLGRKSKLFSENQYLAVLTFLRLKDIFWFKGK